MKVTRCDFEDVEIPENKLKLNTYSNFSVPHAMSKDHIKAYHFDQLINHIIAFLKDHHAEEYLKIYRDMDTIYFETVFHTPKTPEEKKLFQEVVDKFNRTIGQINSAVKSRFTRRLRLF